LPSNGIGFWSGCVRGSSIIFGIALSRVALSGHSIQEKMTVSSPNYETSQDGQMEKPR
jgi:hypothetical protein